MVHALSFLPFPFISLLQETAREDATGNGLVQGSLESKANLGASDERGRSSWKLVQFPFRRGWEWLGSFLCHLVPSCWEILWGCVSSNSCWHCLPSSLQVKRIAYQTLVRTLHTATQVQRSRKAAEAQGQGLVILAKNQAQELMQLGYTMLGRIVRFL